MSGSPPEMNFCKWDQLNPRWWLLHLEENITDQLWSPRNLPVSSSPLLGVQVCAIVPTLFFPGFWALSLCPHYISGPSQAESPPQLFFSCVCMPVYGHVSVCRCVCLYMDMCLCAGVHACVWTCAYVPVCMPVNVRPHVDVQCLTQ